MTHPTEHELMLLAGGELPRAERDRLAAHLESCAACRTTASALADMDRLLRSMPPPEIPAGFAARVAARARLAAPRWTRTRLAAAACLLVAVGLAGGWAAARAFAVPPAIVRDAEGRKFLLVFVESADAVAASGPERQRRTAEFIAWLRSIGGADVRLGGAQLAADRGRVVSAAPPLSSGATPPDPVLTGFVVVRAESYEEVERYARRCPTLARGGQVIVRQLGS